MDRGACQATVHGVTRVRHDWVTKSPPPEAVTETKIQVQAVDLRSDVKNGQEGEIDNKGFAVKPVTTASKWNSVPPGDSGIQCIKHQGTVENKAK